MPPRGENPDIVRIIEGVRGEVGLTMELIIRFDYGRSSRGSASAMAGSKRSPGRTRSFFARRSKRAVKT
jgi:hypothetical protein